MKFNLPKEFKIACEIYRCKKKDIKCTHKYLIDTFKKYGLSKDETESLIWTLFDWSILTFDYDDKLDLSTYLVNNQSKSTIKGMYKRYWKKERKLR